MSADTDNDPAQQTPPPPPSPASAKLAAGGIYIKWQERLWQEQPDGSYLVWNEGTHSWERSQRQPPREGGAVQTKECPSCGRRVKSSFRACPHCSQTFPVVARPSAPQHPVWTPTPWYRKPVPSWVALALVGLIAVTTIFMVLSLRSADRCTDWNATNEAFARNAALAQGNDVDGAELDELITRYESRFSNEKPEGC